MWGLEAAVPGFDSVPGGSPALRWSPERGGTAAESDVCSRANYSSD